MLPLTVEAMHEISSGLLSRLARRKQDRFREVREVVSHSRSTAAVFATSLNYIRLHRTVSQLRIFTGLGLIFYEAAASKVSLIVLASTIGSKSVFSRT